jgi:hypothetical protein
MEDQVPVFMLPSDRVARLYTHAPCSLVVAFYDSLGNGGGILNASTREVENISIKLKYSNIKETLTEQQ